MRKYHDVGRKKRPPTHQTPDPPDEGAEGSRVPSSETPASKRADAPEGVSAGEPIPAPRLSFQPGVGEPSDRGSEPGKDPSITQTPSRMVDSSARRSRGVPTSGKLLNTDRLLAILGIVIAIALGAPALFVAEKTDRRVERMEPSVQRLLSALPVEIPIYVFVRTAEASDITKDVSWWGRAIQSGATTYQNRHNTQPFVVRGRLHQFRLLARHHGDDADLERDARDLADDFTKSYPDAPVGFVIGPVTSGQASILKEKRPFAERPLIVLMPIPSATDVRDGSLHMYQMSADNESQLMRALQALKGDKSPLVIVDDGEFNSRYWRDLYRVAKAAKHSRELTLHTVSEFDKLLPSLDGNAFSGIYYAGMFDKTRFVLSMLQARESWRDIPILLADGCARAIVEGLAIDLTLEHLYLLFQSEVCIEKEGAAPDTEAVLSEAAQGCPITAAPLGYDAMDIVKRAVTGQGGELTVRGIGQWLAGSDGRPGQTVFGMAQQYSFNEEGKNTSGKWFLFRVKRDGSFARVESIQR